MKLLDTGIIYPIADSPWVSPIHCVQKKGGIIVVTNKNDELVPTRTITGWRFFMMKLYVMASNGYLPTLVFSPEQGFNRVLKVSFFNDEEETTSRPKANTLFIPTENLSALVIHPLEAWPRNASAEKPKGVSSPTQTNGK
ncbi:hypothetical protein Tco_1525776 [Tanacetum coccineum]